MTLKETEFINEITEIVKENLSDEQFGVSELADKMAMSRSNLLRKVKKTKGISVSQFIRDERLDHSIPLLEEENYTISEISYKTGFNSPSYFIKCFHEKYGYSPGEHLSQKQVESGISEKVAIKENESKLENEKTSSRKRNKKQTALIAVFSFVLIASVLFAIFYPFGEKTKVREKSIAVLPFKNDSQDSSNLYFVNGVMESILNNLQKIKDLRVISRTSVEKYRNSDKSISEIAKELNVSYFIEGSGQKINDNILLNIQLIEAENDKHLWSEQYKREIDDIFDIQLEIARNITERIAVIITPDEKERIEKIPTQNVEAYNYYLKGREALKQGTAEGLVDAEKQFNKAIELDNEFALSYAFLAITYYYFDIIKTEKTHLKLLNFNADKALFYDSDLSQSYMAKGFYYLAGREYSKALPYFEKSLELKPNSAWTIGILSEFYNSYIPNTEKYLMNALKGLQLEGAALDSSSMSFTYLHLSNAFIQNGFVEEANEYINKSLQFKPNNLYAQYLQAYVVLAKEVDFKKAHNMLQDVFSKDTSRLDVLQEIGKINYLMFDFEAAEKNYTRFLRRKKQLGLDIYRNENLTMAVVFSKTGNSAKADSLIRSYKEYCEQDNSIYKELNLAMYHLYFDEIELAYKHLNGFAEENDYFYRIPLFLEKDPLIQKIKSQKQFQEINNKLKTKFKARHRQIRKELESKNLINSV